MKTEQNLLKDDWIKAEEKAEHGEWLEKEDDETESNY